MNFLRRFMMGRHGADQLTIALLVLGLLVSFIGRLVPIPVVSLIIMLLSYAVLIYAIFRTLSRNNTRRYDENYKFLKIWNPIYNKIKSKINEWRDTTHKYYKCPACSKKLRVPKGRGRIEIRCSNCNHTFVKKT